MAWVTVPDATSRGARTAAGVCHIVQTRTADAARTVEMKAGWRAASRRVILISGQHVHFPPESGRES